MKKIRFIFTIVAALFFVQGLIAQTQTSGVVTDKWAEGPDSDGNYTLTLESYVTGKIGQQTVPSPADIILAMDYSGSMKNNGGYDIVSYNNPTTKWAETSGHRMETTKNTSSSAWTYSNLKYGNATGTANYQWYYQYTDGVFYPVCRANNLPDSNGTNKARAMWIVVDGVTWYLRTDGTGSSYLDTDYNHGATSNDSKLYRGTLVKGWTYKTHSTSDDSGNTTYQCKGIQYGNATGTASKQFYYLHTDGNYYPVRRANNLPDANGGNSACAFWVVIGGTTYYLTAAGLTNDYDHTIVTQYRCIYFGNLYRGWTYADIKNGTAATSGSTGSNGGHYYLHTDGNHYPVTKETVTVDGTKTYQVYVQVPEGKRYLTGEGLSENPYPYTVATDISLYFGELCTVKKVTGYTRYVGLKRAVTAFLDGLAEISQSAGGKVHRVAFVDWGSQQYMKTNGTYNNGTSNNHTKRARPFLMERVSTGTNYLPVSVLKDFRDMSIPSEVADLQSEFDTTPATWQNATDPSWGMFLCDALFKREATVGGYDFNQLTGIDDFEKPSLGDAAAATYKSDRKRILIIISDGELNHDVADGKTKANEMKADGVLIYFIHVNSSNTNANEKAIASGPDYVIKATNYDETLLEAMLSITSDIEGSAIDLGANAIVQDVVTEEFLIPAGSEIKLYTSDCTGYDEDAGELLFSSERIPFNGSVTRNTNPDGTSTVQVTGFDFATNWCGEHHDGGVASYSGKKLIIVLKIRPKEALIGGEVFTNTTQSEILDGDGEPVADFPRPLVGPFPIHLQILKSGLAAGESAVFIIMRKLIETTDPESDEGGEGSGDGDDEGEGEEPGDDGYVEFMRVVLTGKADGSDVTADIRNLSYDYYYKIKETDWSWRYTPSVTEITTEEQSLNPFIFTNSPKESALPKSGEDIQQNKFF